MENSMLLNISFKINLCNLLPQTKTTLSLEPSTEYKYTNEKLHLFPDELY